MSYRWIPMAAFLMGIILFTHPAQAIVLKIATLSPEGSFWMEKMREGAKEVETRTDKRVRFKFYPGGVMGADDTVLRKIRIGQLHGGAVVAGSLATYYPDNQVYSLPLKFRSFEEADYVRRHMDPVIVKGLEQGGFVALGMACGGFAHIMSRHPIRTLEDLRKQKVWVPDNDSTAKEVVSAFDIKPIPLTVPEVRPGLQTGLIDTVATPPVGAVILQWHTQVKYLLEVPFMYVYAIFAVDKRAFSKIGPEDQKIVRQVIGDVFDQLEKKNIADNSSALNVLKDQGIQFIRPTDAELEKWNRTAEGVSDLLVKKGKLSRHIVEMLEKHLNDYRSGHAGINGKVNG